MRYKVVNKTGDSTFYYPEHCYNIAKEHAQRFGTKLIDTAENKPEEKN